MDLFLFLFPLLGLIPFAIGVALGRPFAHVPEDLRPSGPWFGALFAVLMADTLLGAVFLRGIAIFNCHAAWQT